MKLSKSHCSLGDIEVVVEYYYSPGDPGRMYMPNGDPGYPPEPADVDFHSVTIDGCDIQEYLNDSALEKLAEQIHKEMNQEPDCWD